MECKKIEEQLIDYLEGEITENDVDIHIKHCDSCRAQLEELEQMKTLLIEGQKEIEPPSEFIQIIQQNVLTKLNKAERKPLFKRLRTWLIAGTLAICFAGTAVAAVGLESISDWWSELSSKMQKNMDENIKLGIGSRLNLVAIDKNIKVTITDVVADDIQTYIYYEIEDLSQEQQYMINYSIGVDVIDQTNTWDNDYDMFPIHNHMRFSTEEEYILKGRLGMLPIKDEQATIQLKLNQLEKAKPLFEEEEYIFGEEEMLEGVWSFEIPLEKHTAIVKELDVRTQINDVTIHFDQITIAPTVTRLSYSYIGNSINDSPDYIEFSSIDGRYGLYYPDLFLGGGGGPSGVVDFDSMYHDQPNQVTIHIASFGRTIKNEVTIPLNKESNRTAFDYLGTNIEVEITEFGNPTKLMLTEDLNKDRQYERLDFDVITESENVSTSISSDGYFIDRKGQRYDILEYFLRRNELDKARLYTTINSVVIRSKDEETILPSQIKVNGYQVTEFINEVIVIELN